MRLHYSLRAVRDLHAAAAYVRHHDLEAALQLGQGLRSAIEGLASFPERGRPGRISGMRELMVTGTPYLVACRARGGEILILAVLHGSRRWPEAF
jgi:toxin ParE1/3/4